MDSAANQKLVKLEAFLKDYPHITYATPSSPNYASLREIFSLDCNANPLIIVRPQTAEDVALLVQYAKSQGIKFVVEPGKKSAKVGGGTLQGALAAQLFQEGLATPTGTVPSVGYVGWAAYGGYGPLSARFGLGADQIMGVKLVNPLGNIVEADDRLLRGIRGAGGIFGIIVEVVVKVYPLTKVLAGVLIFESQNITAAFKKLNERYRELSAQGLPSELGVQQMVVNSPHGRALALTFMWSSADIETGRAWLSKCETFGTVVMNTIAVTTLPEFLRVYQEMVPSNVYGFSRTHNLREMTEEVTTAITPCLEIMPSDPGTMFAVHELRGPSASPTKESVFGTREHHFMVEILGTSVKIELREAGLKWANSIWEAVDKTSRYNILPGTYISLDPPGESPGQIPLFKIYGSHESDVLALKKEYDGDNVFDMAIPRLVDYLHG
ncbi:hypothetical protein EG329_012973 [Mollisiaceae sp. DMI_Dod_QoI]|nr:hypothetical protein EG329_012973 [Helotiales sp. DMI_Dod_QoI]